MENKTKIVDQRFFDNAFKKKKHQYKLICTQKEWREYVNDFFKIKYESNK